jgi:biopolymer transport protein TolR
MKIATRRWRATGIRRADEYYCRIDVSALGAVIVVLATMAAVLRQVPRSHSYGPELPKSDHASSFPGALREDALWVAITRDGRYFFGASQISLAELAGRVREGLRRGAERKVYMSVDEHVRYRNFALAADEIRNSGIAEVGFLTR